jgi:hypothetical protein
MDKSHKQEMIFLSIFAVTAVCISSVVYFSEYAEVKEIKDAKSMCYYVAGKTHNPSEKIEMMKVCSEIKEQ